MDRIIMEHGSGGRATNNLINEIFAVEFSDIFLGQMEDAAVVDSAVRIAVTTDSFVVTPLEFPGGDIGRLSICGTVNDLLMRGAVPKYITCGFILQEGLEISLLRRIAHSMAETAREAGVQIIAGDTKVVEGNGGIYINTTGVGFVNSGVDISVKRIKSGDSIIVSGDMGNHHAAIQSMRMEINNSIESDNAPLNVMVKRLIEQNIEVHALRDVTRGGLATVLKELADDSAFCFEIEERKIPVNPMVKDFCGLLGLEPLYMGNEGKLVAIVAPEDEAKALSIIQSSPYGENAAVIGKVLSANEGQQRNLIVRTPIGGRRVMNILEGEGLPRIC